MLGYNYRLSNIEAAIAMEQLKKLDRINEKRVENANFLNERLSGIENIELPTVLRGHRHVFHQYTIKVLNGKRDAVLQALNKRGIEARVYYSKPIYMQPIYQRVGLISKCPVAEEVSGQVLSLPIHPNLGKSELKMIAKEVKDVLRN